MDMSVSIGQAYGIFLIISECGREVRSITDYILQYRIPEATYRIKDTSCTV